MDQGGRIHVTADRRGDVAVVCVRDEGIGIAPEHLKQVFDLFSQIDRSRHQSQNGLGIGLALVRCLVEMHGGRIEAHSAGLGQGSEFIVYLPLAGLAALSSAEPAESPRSPSACRILIVDDNRDAADSLALLVEGQGAEVSVAYEGGGALAMMHVFNPDLVLLDLGMPGMDGYEVARRIRQLPNGQGITLIAVTGWGQDDDRRMGRDAGFDHHLVKPVSLAILQPLIASATREE